MGTERTTIHVITLFQLFWKTTIISWKSYELTMKSTFSYGLWLIQYVWNIKLMLESQMMCRTFASIFHCTYHKLYYTFIIWSYTKSENPKKYVKYRMKTSIKMMCWQLQMLFSTHWAWIQYLTVFGLNQMYTKNEEW